MKFRATKKAIMEEYKNTIKIGYCNAQHLLTFENPIAYTHNSDGWCCDIYIIGNDAISTGYAPFGKIIPSYNCIKEWDKKAEAIINSSHSLGWETQKELVSKVLSDFIKEVTKGR